MQPLAPGHPSSYDRVLSKRRWPSWRLARGLAGDDTVDEHRGPKVYGKACHRDAVRSTHSFNSYRGGHKCVRLAILVKFPFSYRLWALPVLAALCRSKEWNQKDGLRHKTPSQLMRQLLTVLIHWCPQRQFLFAGDGGFGTHEVACLTHGHHSRLTLVSRFHSDANLYAPPPLVKGKRNGRPRKKGRKLTTPANVVKTSSRSRLTGA